MYNRKGIEDNRRMLVRSNEECFLGLSNGNEDEKRIAEERLKTNFLLTSYVLDILKEMMQDEYLNEVIAEGEKYRQRWKDYYKKSSL